jgi:hypothetical protein
VPEAPVDAAPPPDFFGVDWPERNPALERVLALKAAGMRMMLGAK